MAKTKQKDFAKVKLKVGRKLQPANSTNTEFKAKKVVIRGTKDLAVDPVHCLTACSTSSPSVKLMHLNKLAASNVLTSSHLITGHLLNALARLSLDSDSKVRKQARVCIQQSLTSMSNDQLRDSVSLLLPHVKCGLTHLDPGIAHESRALISFLIVRSSDDQEKSFMQILRTRLEGRKGSISLFDLELASEVLTRFRQKVPAVKEQKPRFTMDWNPANNFVPWFCINRPRLSVDITFTTSASNSKADEVINLLRKFAVDGIDEFSRNCESRSSLTVDEGRRLLALLKLSHCLLNESLVLPEYTVVSEKSHQKQCSSLNRQIRDLVIRMSG